MSDLPPGFFVVKPGTERQGLPPGFSIVDPVVNNPPPPGVIIHEANRSYVTGSPDAPSVNTTGMKQEPGQPNPRDIASAGLAARRDEPWWLRMLSPVFQGVSAGFGDEAVSAAKGAENVVRGGDFSSAYNVAQEAQRQSLAQARTEHPIASLAGQVGGALALAPALAPLLSAGSALPLAGRAAAGAGAGAVYGGAEGFGSGSGIDDRLGQAATGAALGAGVGAAVPVIGAGVKAGANKLIDRFTTQRGLSNLGMGRPAGAAVMRGLSADDAFSGAGIRNITDAGPEGMLVDAGPSTRGVLDAAMQRGGPATLTARQAVDQRGGAATDALNAALDRTLGQSQGVNETAAGIRQGTAAARQTAYDAAYKAPIDYSSPQARQLQSLLKRVPDKAIAKANELMQLEGEQSNQILAKLDPSGKVTFERLPDVRQLDYITRGLRQLAEAGEDAGKLGARTDFSQAATNLARNIRGTLRDLVPEYGTALETAADPISRINAIRFGADMLKPSIGRDEVAMQIRGMSGPEKAALRQGVRSHIDDLMANTKAAASDPNQDAREGIAALRQLASRAQRDKLATILDPQDAASLTREIARASKAFELYAGTSRNSATYGRTAVDQANKQMLEPGVIGTLAEGKPLQATQRIAQLAFGRTPQDKLIKEDKMYQQIAEILTGRRGPNAITAMNDLTRLYLAGPQNEKTATAIGNNLGLGIGLAGYQPLRQLERRP